MPYLIDASDRKDGAEIRAANRPAHLAFLESQTPLLLAAGAKLSDDGETAWGSVYIIDVEDRAKAEAFIADDPYVRAGLFAELKITRWRKGFFDFARIVQKG